MVRKIAYSKDALKALRRMPREEAHRIRGKIEQYAAEPTSQANNVKTLRGRDGLRLRVGDWRVIFEDDLGTMNVLLIGPRGSIYGSI
jgi:mRNA interferase RelE/StbE